MSCCLFVSTEKWDPVSGLIRFEEDADWSHTGWYYIEKGATFSAMADGKGVAWRDPIPQAKILLLNAPFADETQKIAEEKAGCGYDFLDILGIAFRQNWQTEGRMICDKLVFWAYMEYAKRQLPNVVVGAPLLNHTFIPLEHFTPRDILVSPFVSERK